MRATIVLLGAVAPALTALGCGVLLGADPPETATDGGALALEAAALDSAGAGHYLDGGTAQEGDAAASGAPEAGILTEVDGDDGALEPSDAEDDGGPRVTTRFLGAARNANAVAFQDGDGGWSLLAGSSGRYPLPVTTGVYSVSAICTSTGPIFVVRTTPAERTAITIECGVDLAFPTVSGAVTGVKAIGDNGGGAYAAIGESSATLSTSYSMPAAPGSYDLLAADFTVPFDDAIIIRRGLAVSGNVAASLDFGTQGVAPIASGHTITVGSASSGDPVESFLDFQTASTPAPHSPWVGHVEHGIPLATGTATLPDNGVTGGYRVLPQGVIASGDLYSATAVDVVSNGGTPSVLNAFRTIQHFFATPADVLLDLPPQYTPALAYVSAGQLTSSVQVTLPPYPGAKGYEIDCTTEEGEWHVEISAQAFGSDGSYVIPDPSLPPMIGYPTPPGFTGASCAFVGALSGDDPYAPVHDGVTLGSAGAELSLQPVTP